MDIKKVVENRQKIIKNAIDRDHFNIDIYANLFEVKPRVIKNDLKALKIINYKDQNISLQPLLKNRDKILKKNDDKSYDEKLESVGMWHKPLQNTYFYDDKSQIQKIAEILHPKQSQVEIVEACKKYLLEKSDKNKENLINCFEKYVPNFEKALSDLQRGTSISKIQEKYQYTTYQRTKFSNLKDVLEVKKTFDKYLLSDPQIYQTVKNIVENNPNINYISRCIGITTDTLQEIKNGTYSQNLIISIKTEIIDRQKKVWDLYNKHGSSHGYTQQEIADMLGITRATVNSDIRQYKLDHPEEIDETQIYRARHAGIEKLKIREDKKDLIIAIWNKCKQLYPDISEKECQNKVCKLMSKNSILKKYIPNVPQYLQEAGLFIDIAINDNMVHEAEIGYQHRGQFAYGSTPALLAEHEFSSVKEKNAQRYKILDDQKRTMALLRNNQGIRQAFKEKHGNLKEAIEIAEADKNQELEDVSKELI